MIFSLLVVASFLFIALSYRRGPTLPRRFRLPTAGREWSVASARADDCSDDDGHPDSRACASLRSFMLPRSWSTIVVNTIVITTMIVARSRLVLASALRAVASAMARASVEMRRAYVFAVVTSSSRRTTLILATDPEPNPAQNAGSESELGSGTRDQRSGIGIAGISRGLPPRPDGALLRAAPCARVSQQPIASLGAPPQLPRRVGFADSCLSLQNAGDVHCTVAYHLSGVEVLA
jgi:hypothetical protein